MLLKGVFAIGAGVLSEFVVDFFRIPLLSESGMFGGPSTKTNYEIVVYALATGGAAAGIMDYFSNSKPLGFSKEFLPYFIGFGMGTGLYESLIVPAVPVLRTNPYQVIFNAVPSIPLL